MLEISPEIHQKLKNTLLNCDQFANPGWLRSLFVDRRISRWRNDLPEADPISARVDVTIDFLADRYTEQQQNALVLFLQVLSDQFDEEALHYKLLDLASELESTLTGDTSFSKSKGVYLSPVKRQQLEKESREIRDLLILFERAAFSVHEGYYGYGDPTAVFNAIRETRIELQRRGATFVVDPRIADVFSEIRTQLFQLESDIGKQYPRLVELAAEWRDRPTGSNERITAIKDALGDEAFTASAKQIRLVASSAKDLAEGIRIKLRTMNEMLMAD